MNSQAPKSICLLRLSALGDVCHAAALVSRLQRHWPECQLTWVIGKLERQLVGDIAGVEFVEFDKKQGWTAWRGLRKQLRDRQFDVLLHMQIALRASLVSLAIPANKRLGFDRTRAREGQWLFSNQKIEPQDSPHVLEGFMAFADALGVPDDPKPTWDIPIPVSAQSWAAEQIGSATAPVVIVPSASKLERNWMAERYAAVADYLIDRGATLFLCGGPSAMEKQCAAEVEQATRGKLVNLVGQTDLKQMLALLKLAKLVLSPDTGPAHMAVTQGTPVVGLYAHSNPSRTGPYLYREYAVSVYDEVVAEQKGASHTDLRWGVRAKGENLMQRIEVEAVLAAINRVIVDFALPIES